MNENIGVGLLSGWGCICVKLRECVFKWVGVFVFKWLILKGNVWRWFVRVMEGGLFVWFFW